MHDSVPRITYIGGPTALIEWRGLRLLTDPTFDPAGERYVLPAYTLSKTEGPAVAAHAIGSIDAVLLSHEHHFDNLDHAGRALLPHARTVLTTLAGAERLGGNATGMVPWATHDLQAPGGLTLHVTAAPARHGPEQAERGPVIGFALTFDDDPRTLYISGDTVWFDGLRAVAERFTVTAACLFVGAAQVRAVGDFHLTLTAAESVLAARLFEHATIIPLHCEGWEHFTESCVDVDRAFRAAGMQHRLLRLERGKQTAVP